MRTSQSSWGHLNNSRLVIPAKAGIQFSSELRKGWIPAFAGMTAFSEVPLTGRRWLNDAAQYTEVDDMKLLILASMLLLQASCALLPAGQEVTASALIANPARYNGKRVQIHGFVSYGFENCLIDRQIWYWPADKTCYGLDSMQDALEGQGTIIGIVSMSNHGHLGTSPFSIIQARAVRDR